jgi:hypothetical protein
MMNCVQISEAWSLRHVVQFCMLRGVTVVAKAHAVVDKPQDAVRQCRA